MPQPPQPDRPHSVTALERPRQTPRLDDERRTATMPGAADQPPSDNTDPLIGVAVGEGYEIRAKLAEGGMGALYVAAHRDAPSKRKAIKVLLPSLLAKCSPRTRDDIWHRFETEAKIALRLDHPNVIVVDGYDRLPEGAIYIKMELLEGKNLRQWARDRHGGIVPADDVLRVMAQVCGALERAHNMPERVVHRDLKPENIFVVATDDGSIKTKLLDFGIARVIDPQALPGGKKTTLPRAMGTPGYWSPEQQTSPADVDHRADIYAAGVILFELTTGRLPGFGSLAPHQLPPTFPPEWYSGVAAALAGDPQQRPQSIRDLLNFLIDRTPNGSAIAHEACPSLYKVSVAPSDSTTRAPLSGIGSAHGVTAPPALPPSTLAQAAAYSTQPPQRRRSLLLAALGGAAVTALIATGVITSLNSSSSTSAANSPPPSSQPPATTSSPPPAATSSPASTSSTPPAPGTSSPAAASAPPPAKRRKPPKQTPSTPSTRDMIDRIDP